MKSYWYADGLHFECLQCGRCCAGPAEGYIWVSRPEIQIIANFLKMTVGQVRRKYLKRVGLRLTIIEQPVTKDCIFLQAAQGQRICMIYPVRPSQCRSWPFWASNLASLNDWNQAARKCPGINRGKLHTCEQIEDIKRSRKWWQDTKQPTRSCKQ